ncbi:DUF2750 domain-containing protein [Flavihumibacter petaseus]|uniref:DUF2750 domain-containing protein n=1 Tax=Flavihumibacter petaseus NBRC 106054 TaxID=1220578 RepID=A0A0E9N3Z2_9BACT|nr:DUF2750 domain-containing protein [Flavihumibacter petaseus]GAO44702.1 hypothetical protein FPE01S_03_07410 [Flavihumibacter petaseus NBRC 106054]
MNQQEIDQICRLEPDARYRYAIRRIADAEQVCVLRDEDDQFALSEADGRAVIKIWPAAEFALALRKGEWEDNEAYSFNLNEMEDVLFPLIRDNDYLIDVFPVEGKPGVVVTLDQLVKDLNDELDKYK